MAYHLCSILLQYQHDQCYHNLVVDHQQLDNTALQVVVVVADVHKYPETVDDTHQQQ